MEDTRQQMIQLDLPFDQAICAKVESAIKDLSLREKDYWQISKKIEIQWIKMCKDIWKHCPGYQLLVFNNYP